jgi:hypothetical protein
MLAAGARSTFFRVFRVVPRFSEHTLCHKTFPIANFQLPIISSTADRPGKPFNKSAIGNRQLAIP